MESLRYSKANRWGDDCHKKYRLLLSVQVKGHTLLLKFTGGSRRSGRRLREKEGTMSKSHYFVFHGKEWACTVSRLVWVISVGFGTESLSLVVWYLALRWLGQKVSGLECKSPIKKVVRIWVWTGWFVFENMLTCKLFTILRDWQFLGGEFSLTSARPRCETIRIQKIKDC